MLFASRVNQLQGKLTNRDIYTCQIVKIYLSSAILDEFHHWVQDADVIEEVEHTLFLPHNCLK